MNLTIKKTAIALAVTSILGLSACMHEEDATTAAPINKSTSGVITGFGSVFINGIEYETDNTNFTIDGVVGDETLLKLGMVVSLSGSASDDGTGNALTIDFDDDVEGVVIATNLDALGNGTLNIMGVTVTVDEDTVFESKTLDITSILDVVKGNIIEVSGHTAGDGNVWATRIEVKSVAKELNKEMEVKGIVSGLDMTLKTFVLGAITVDYSNAIIEDDFIIEDALFIQVKSKSGFNDSNQLNASKIELESRGKRKLDRDENDDEVELAGVITNIVSATEIEVNGNTVILSDTTQYLHQPAVTALGMKIKVKGSVDVDGQLVADKVIFKPSGDLKLEGLISATNIDLNTITVFGIDVALNNSTMVKDNRDDDDLMDEENVKYKFGVDDLVIGNWVKVKVFINSDGGFTAMKMRRNTSEVGELEKLAGNLTVIAATDTTPETYEISGIKLDLTSASEIIPTDGMRIKLKGTFANGVFTALSAEEKERERNYVGGRDGDDREFERRDDHRSDDDDDKEEKHMEGHDEDKQDDDGDHGSEVNGRHDSDDQ